MKGSFDFDKTPCHNFKIDKDLTPEAWARFAAAGAYPRRNGPNRGIGKPALA